MNRIQIDAKNGFLAGRRRDLLGLCGVTAVVLLSLVAPSDAVQSQAAGFAVTPLLREALPGDPAREVVVVMGVFEPGGTTGLHTHPGDEYATVVEGALELVAAGGPPRRVTAGQAYHNPRGLAHETRNAGPGIARVASTFIVDSGKPIVERLDRSAGQP